MNPLHVVEKVPVPWEAVALDRSFAVFNFAQVRSVAMSVKPVCLALVSQETRRGRKLCVGAVLHFASEWLHVRVNILAVE